MNSLELALDHYGEYDDKFKFGRNPNIGSGGNEDVVEQGGLMLYDSGGTIYEVVSSEAADAGVVWLEGVDANYNWVREWATLNGTGAVEFDTEFYSAFRARSVLAQTGVVTFRKKTGPATRVIIPIGLGGTLIAAMTIPRNYRIAISRWSIDATKDAANNVNIYAQLLTRVPPDGAWTIQDTIEYRTASGEGIEPFDPWRGFNGPLDIRVHVAECSANSIRIGARIGYAMKNLRGTPFGPTLVNQP